MGTSLVAGALLAFALSFDEIIVTTFTAGAGTQTLPIWIFSNYSRPNQLPLVNVASVMVLLLSIIPVYIAARITSDPSAGRRIAGADRSASSGGRSRRQRRGHGDGKASSGEPIERERTSNMALGTSAGSRSGTIRARPHRGVPGRRRRPRSIRMPAYLRLTRAHRRPADGSHRRDVVLGEVLLAGRP